MWMSRCSKKSVMDGFLNLDKPLGFTSHDCVAKVRKLLKLKRVGHAGTLDPAATGVLPIAIGRATRLLQYLNHDKAYRATIRLGLTTTTDDLQGETLTSQPVPMLTLAQVQAQLPLFQGQLQQVPPNYSAIQMAGQRMYDRARAGEVVDIPARAVEVYHLAVVDWRAGDFPELELAIACGSGTYIRSIARDLGAVLQTGGTLAALIRTESCGLTLANSVTFADLLTQVAADQLDLIAPEMLLSHLPRLTLLPELAQRWRYGQKILAPAEAVGLPSLVRVHQLDHRFLGISQITETPDGLLLVPQMVFEPMGAG
jgi:tRNA pseudouridine55 synthase